MSTDKLEQRWFIDLSWFEQNDRSFFALAQGCLCPKCAKRLKVREGEISPTALLSAIKDCCSKNSGFITRKLPILECVFRICLANGNHPLNLEELGRKLSEWREGDAYYTSAEILSRLLKNDPYCGIRQIPS